MAEQDETQKDLLETLKAVYGSLQVIEHGAKKNGDRAALNLSRESIEWITESLRKAGYVIKDGRLYSI